MSQQLQFILKYKTNPSITLDFKWYSTTPARWFSSEGLFPYAEADTAVSQSQLQENIEFLEEEITKNINAAESIQRIVDSLGDRLEKTKSKTAFDSLYDKMMEKNEEFEEIKSETETLVGYKTDLEYLKSLFDIPENEENWNLYYYNC